jgi:hypothetical protein
MYRAFVVGAVAALAASGATAAPVVGGVATPIWARGIALPEPANLSTALDWRDSDPESVSCTSAGNCVAVGSYDAGGHHQTIQPLIATESDGVWGQPSEHALPGLPPGPGGSQWLESVSCTSPGDCTALGTFGGLDSDHQMVAEESDGLWGPASELPEPAGADVGSLTCTSAGNCVAVGYLDLVCDGAGNCLPPWATQGVTYPIEEDQPLVVTETGGVWAWPSEIALPLNATPAGGPDGQPVALNAIACASAGNCVAAGEYSTALGSLPLVVTESDGVWGQASAPSPPAGEAIPDDFIRSVACPDAGNCVAVGGDNGNVYPEPIVATEASGVWGPAMELALPPTGISAQPPNGFLTSVTCTGVGSCVAVGGYLDGEETLVASEYEGTWGQGQTSEIELPAGGVPIPPQDPLPTLHAVTCVSPGACVAVGVYKSKSDGISGEDAMAASSVPQPASFAAPTFAAPTAAIVAPGSASTVSVRLSAGVSAGLVASAAVLPPGTIASLYPAAVKSTLARQLPAGRSYVAGVGAT